MLRQALQAAPLLSILSLFNVSGHANAQDSTRFEIVGDPREQIRKEATISGNLVVGAIVVTAPIEPLPQLFAYVPAWRDEALCARVVSSDGTYEAEMDFRTPPDWSGGGPVDFEFTSRYPERVSMADPGAIAARLTRGDCSNVATVPEVLPAWWNQKTSENGTLALLINSTRADSVHAYVGDDPAAPAIACTAINANRRISYDVRCDIPLYQLGPGSQQIELQLQRNGIYDYPAFVKIASVP